LAFWCCYSKSSIQHFARKKKNVDHESRLFLSFQSNLLRHFLLMIIAIDFGISTGFFQGLENTNEWKQV